MRKMRKKGRKPTGRYSAWEVQKRDVQRRVKIAAHNRNAVELAKHYIVWKDRALACRDCQRRCAEMQFI